MSRHNFTMKELEEWTDYEVLETIVTSRRSNCTNYYAPLYGALTKLLGKLRGKKELTK